MLPTARKNVVFHLQKIGGTGAQHHYLELNFLESLIHQVSGIGKFRLCRLINPPSRLFWDQVS